MVGKLLYCGINKNALYIERGVNMLAVYFQKFPKHSIHPFL